MFAPNTFYNPSYQRPSTRTPTRVDRRFLGDEGAMQEYARELAEKRARRAQYLPDEDFDSDDEWECSQLGPRQQAYLEAKRRQAILERQREEQLERQRVLEEKKWQEALERKQREDEEYRRKLLDERRRELRSKREEDAQQEQRERETRASQTAAPGGSSPTAAAHEKKSVPIFIPVQPQQQATPPSSPPQPAPSLEEQLKQKHTLEQMNNAASRIQREYRVHQASRALDDIASQFKQLQQEFAYPRVIDFKKPGGERGHITVPANRPPSDFTDEALKEVSDCEGKLDYTSTNYPLHAYSDALDKLLMKLDGVESRGEKSIREKRRGIVKEIEKEVSRLDWYWRQAWIDYIKAQETAMDL